MSLSSLPRRLSLVGVLCLVGAASAHASAPHAAEGHAAEATVDIMTEEKQDLTSPLQAYEWLVAGNERFRKGQPRPRDLVAQREALAHGQHPFATILSCMDSRTSSELIFDAQLGDLFNVRIAGNVATDDILGSLEYAHKVAGAKLLVVLGHSHCGAVKGAADDVVMGNLTGLVARIRPAVAAIPPDGKPRTSKNLDFVDKAGRMHVILTVRLIRERSPLLRDMQDRGLIDIVGAFHDLETGRVEFYRPLSGSGPIRTTTTLLAPTPAAKDHTEEPTDEAHAEEGSETDETSDHAEPKPSEPAEAEKAHEAPEHAPAAH